MFSTHNLNFFLPSDCVFRNVEKKKIPDILAQQDI